jgi:hypothetical protein
MTWAPDYTTVDRLQSYLSTDDLEFLQAYLSTASRNVDDHCNRQFGQVDVPEQRVYRNPVWDRARCRWVYTIDDLHDLTGFAVEDATGTAITDHEFEPDNALVKGKPYERLLTARDAGSIRVTGLWGWSAVPSAVEMGLLLQASRLDARRNSPFGVAGSPQEGAEVRLLAQLDPDFRTALKPYRRKWWAR